MTHFQRLDVAGPMRTVGIVASERKERCRNEQEVARIPVPPSPSSPAARQVMLANRAESSVERAVRSELQRRGLRFRKHFAPVKGLRCRPDVVFTRARVVVFVDGCFWHRCREHGTSPKINSPYWTAKLDSNVARDRRNTQALESAGWTVLRIWEHESVVAAADVIEALVRDRSGDMGRDGGPPEQGATGLS